jgi:hypothetical protein
MSHHTYGKFFSCHLTQSVSALTSVVVLGGKNLPKAERQSVFSWSALTDISLAPTANFFLSPYSKRQCTDFNGGARRKKFAEGAKNYNH